MKITVDICTKDRYLTTLPLTLMSIALQTRKPDSIIIYDDSSNRIDIRENEVLRYILQLFDQKRIRWEVVFGSGQGQHIGHQLIQDKTPGDLIWRIDDDEVAEANVLETLLTTMLDNTIGKIGGVGGLVIQPGAPEKECPPNIIQNLTDNCQWYRWDGKKEVEHLYSSYLYVKGVHNYETKLSTVAHREETLHTFGIFKKGYKLIVDSQAVTYHLRSSIGGIRTGNQQNWNNDEVMFQGIMREYGINSPKEKNFVINEGMGDHVVFASLIPEIKKKYKDCQLNFYVCYPELLKKHNVNTYSIADAHNRLGDINRFNLYEYMVKSNQKLNLEQAYRKLYNV